MRIFSINFNGGFAIVDNSTTMMNIINYEYGININEFDSIESAYVQCCRVFIDHELKNGVREQIALPKLEDLPLNTAFYKMNHLKQNVGQRVFVAIHPKTVGILTNAEAVVGFYEEIVYANIFEVNTIMEAQNTINFHFLRQIMPMSAYITEKIPYYNNIPTNTLINVDYLEWIKKNLIIPKNLTYNIGLIENKEV